MAGYKFKCKDTGMDCDFEVKIASSRDEVMQEADVHTKIAHGLKTMPRDMEKVAEAIKT